MTIVVTQPAIGEADTYFTGFQVNNPVFNPLIILSNFFVGIQAHGVAKFETGLPKRAEILAATLDITAGQSSANKPNPLVNINSAINGAWKPASFGPAWRGEFWGSFKTLIRDTSGGTIQDIVTSNPTAARNLRQDPLKRLRLGQRINPATAGTLGDIIIRARKVGAPVGNVWIDIVGSDINGPVLATSDVLPAAGFTLFPTFGLETFVFSGANQIQLTPGVVYHALINADFPVNAIDFIQWNEIQQFFGTGGAKHFGTDVAFGTQNYPSHADLSLGLTGLGTNIPWTLPDFVAGVTYTSPSIKNLIQETVNHPTYNSGDAIALTLRSTGGNAFRRAASFDNLSFPPWTLTVDFIPGTFDHITGEGKVTNRIRSKGIVAQIIRGKGQVTQRISSRGTVTQRISKTGRVTTIIRGKGQVTQRITK